MPAIWRRWVGQTLERRIAVYYLTAIVGVCLLFGVISFAASLWMIRGQQARDQAERLGRIVASLDHDMRSLVAQTANLSETPLVFTALLDSRGRDAYLQPFFANYRLSIPQSHGLALCDFEGKPLAVQSSREVSCFGASASARRVIEEEQPQADLLVIHGIEHAVYFHPVLYPGTRSAEGYLVAAVSLREMLADPNLGLPGTVLFLRDAASRALMAVESGRKVEVAASSSDLAHPLFADNPFQSLGLVLAVREPEARPRGSGYVLAGYGIGTLMLLALAWVVSRRAARSLAAPLIALNQRAQRITERGPSAEALRLDREDEIGQLAEALNTMVAALGEQQERLRYLADHDDLTGLPNRRLLSDRMRQAIARANRGHGKIAVCYLDLDGFKPVNDLHGHAEGDRLLVEVARRLRANSRAHDTVSRLGGDEFVLMLTDLESSEQCREVIERVTAGLAQPYALSGGATAGISASVGVALYPGPDDPGIVGPDLLLRRADQAMYQAKKAGRDQIRYFDPCAA